MKPLGQDFGDHLGIVACVDAQAKSGLCCRNSLGKARQMEAAELWTQDLFESGECELRNAGGEDNPA